MAEAQRPSKAALFQKLVDSVMSGAGMLDSGQRKEAFDAEKPSTGAAWIERVRSRAASIEDEHLGELREAGLSEDQIFEMTICAAVGAADLRLRAALRTLGKELP